MEYDIIDIPQEEYGRLSSAQIKLLRAAQGKKNTLAREAEEKVREFAFAASARGTHYSTLAGDARTEIYARLDYDVAVLADNLIYDMSLVPSVEPPPATGDGYVVDYTLSYSARYVAVRNYYMTIEDPKQRLALFAADETAKKYLAGYYSALYNVLSAYAGE